MIYLASPYSHPDPLTVISRFLAAERFTAKGLARGRIIYSPIVHCHALAQKFDLPTTFDFWQNYNLGMLAAAKELWVLKIEGWDTSKGVKEEIVFAHRRNIGITYVWEEYFRCK